MKRSRFRQYAPLLLPLIAVVLNGCQAIGERLQMEPRLEGAPPVEDVLAGLAENDARLENFSAAGDFTIASPKLRATQRIRGRVAFQQPADLHLEGRHRLTGTVVCRLTASGEEFFLEFPTEDAVFYNAEGARVESVPFSVSPSDIVREMFMPEPWRDLPARQARMTGYNPGAGVATIEIGPRNRVRRVLKVAGPPWVIVENRRYDGFAEPIAVTTMNDYRDVDGIRFPAQISAEFPGESTWFTFDLRNIQPNTELDHELFTIDWRYRVSRAPDEPEPEGNRGRIGP